jgi:hypothetical protein
VGNGDLDESFKGEILPPNPENLPLVLYKKGNSVLIQTLPVEVEPEYLNRTFKKRWRWVMLILCSSMVIANYFCFDNPASLET